jgi:hypothetical protein
MPASNEINWPDIHQVRLHHSISKALEILKAAPHRAIIPGRMD